MIALQPVMLWGLSAALLPIIIHLLNRLRYRTVKWGAMMFLLRVSRQSARRSRLRHYLILACRALALAALALAMTRLLAGGWLGAGWGRSPDAVLVLLDRSSSMERVDPAQDRSRRAQAIATLAATPPERVSGSRIVLIESASREPREIASLEALRGLSWTGPTDTAADGPAMFESALAWLERNHPGRAEVWVASDGQRTNWRPDSRAWGDVARRLAALRPAVRVRMLFMEGNAAAENLTLTARSVRARAGGGWDLAYALSSPTVPSEDIPAALVTASGRILQSLTAPGTNVEGSVTIPQADRVGWAGLELPADSHAGDNTAWFVYGPAPEGGVCVSAESPEIRTRIENSFRPPRAADPSPVRAWPASGAPSLNDTALVVWQGTPPRGPAAAALDAFLRGGGVVLALPPAEETSAPDPGAAEGEALWSWSAPERAAAGREWRMARWEATEGPLARSAEGTDLPVGQPEIRTRRGWVAPADSSPFALARFGDGVPALVRAARGAGRIYALSTLPIPNWSGIGDGRIWVPMAWRLREEGARRLGEARLAVCGEWQPGDPAEIWEPVSAPLATESETGNPHDPRTRAGVYRFGSRWIALNRPVEEDDRSAIPPAALPGMLPGVRVEGTEISGGADAAASEITLGLFLLAALFLLAEAALALGLHPRASVRGVDRVAAPAARAEGAS